MTAKHTPGRAGFDTAAAAIMAGSAQASALWTVLSDEHERDEFALRPMPWEGPGEYQAVRFDDGREGFVRIPGDAYSLPRIAKGSKS